MKPFYQVMAVSVITLFVILASMRSPSVPVFCQEEKPCESVKPSIVELFLLSDKVREDSHLFRMEQRKMLIQRIRKKSEYSRKLWIEMRNVWNIHEPTWNCPWEERFGKSGDGGKWVCGGRFLRNPCVIYSFGSAGDTSFETDISQFSSCEIHTFDPSVKVLGFLPSNTHFHRLGIFGEEKNISIGPVTTLKKIMDSLGHKFIDILKIDVEYSEWSIFQQLFSTNFTPFGQVQIELHFILEVTLESYIDFFHKMDLFGFRVFHRDPNLGCDICQEYSFIHKDEGKRLAQLSESYIPNHLAKLMVK